MFSLWAFCSCGFSLSSLHNVKLSPVYSAYFIHETIRDTCTSPQLHPRSGDASLCFGIFFLFKPHPSLPLQPCLPASCLIYLPLKASATHCDFSASEPSVLQVEISPAFSHFLSGCLVSHWPGLTLLVPYFSPPVSFSKHFFD